MREDQINELKGYIKAEGLTQEALADMFDVSQANISALLNGKTPFGKGVASSWEKKLGIRAAWLMIGDGEMLKSQSIHNSGTINAQNGVVGQVHGDFHSDAGKDKLIETQEQQVLRMFEAFMVELREFHGYIQRQDDYIKRQDEHLDNIVNKSYLRNERNMERMDKDRERLDILIQIIDRQNQKVQDRADRLLDLLEKKL